MKRNISNICKFTTICLLASVLFAASVTVFAKENVAAAFTVSQDGNGAHGMAAVDGADYRTGELSKDGNTFVGWTDIQAPEPVVTISNSGRARHIQMVVASESLFPDRTFIAGN